MDKFKEAPHQEGPNSPNRFASFKSTYTVVFQFDPRLPEIQMDFTQGLEQIMICQYLGKYRWKVFELFFLAKGLPMMGCSLFTLAPLQGCTEISKQIAIFHEQIAQGSDFGKQIVHFTLK